MKITKKQLKPIIVSLAIVVLCFSFFIFKNNPETAEAGWWNDSWNYRKALTINHNQVAGDLTNFPVLISLTDTNLSTHAQEDGDDFIFIDSEGKKIKHEIEKYASSTGELVAWVKIPSLSSSDDTEIFMYYGNAGIGNQQDAENVWDENYQGIWHMNELSGTRYDSTSNNNYASDQNTVTASTTGKIGTAAEFVYANDEYLLIDENRQKGFNLVSNFTLSLWVNTNYDSNHIRFFSKHSGSPQREYSVGRHNVSNAYSFYISQNGTSWSGGTTANETATTSEWHNIAYVYDGSYMKVYINGSEHNGGIYPYSYSNGVYNSTSSIAIGRELGGSEYKMEGLLDEIKFSNTNRSSSWIQTEYNNQNSPATFFSEQSEETGPGPVGYWSFDEGYGTTAHDESGQGNDGTISGAVWKDESQCVSGKCLWFDGSGDYVDNGSTTAYNLNTYTISGWLKTSDSSDYKTVLSKTINSNNRNWSLFLWSDSGSSNYQSGELIFRSSSGGVNVNIGTGIVVTDNIWHHFSIVLDDITKAEIYLDGFLKATQNNPGTTDLAAINFYIGRDPDSVPTRDFHGYMDEVKIYPYARTADQIKQDYAAGLAGVKSDHGVSASFGGSSDKWMSDGLVGYWQMDESATTSGAIDASGNGNDGTYYGNASTTAGKFGNGGSFDGDGDYILVDNDSSLNFGTGDFSISLWTRLDRTYAEDHLVKKQNGNPYYNMKWNNRYAQFLIRDTNGNSVLASSNEYTIGEIYYLTGMRDGNKLKLYVNGELVDEEDASGVGSVTNTNPLSIGSSEPSFSQYFDGNLDEVRIYNRALSKSEVRKLYEWAPGPVAHWKFDEKGGTTAYDSVASSSFAGGNDGTINGAAWARGKYGSAVEFNDVDSERITIIQNSSINNLNKFTLSAWLYHKGGNVYYDGIINKDADGFSLYRHGNNFNFAAQRWNSTAGNWNVSYSNILSKWVYISVTYDYSSLSNDPVFYINGQKYLATEEQTPVGTLNTESANICIGNRCTASRPFTGKIDDVRIYNYVRTQKQILEDMNAGRPAQKTPVLHLSFDEGYGETVHDSSIYGNDGTAYVGTGGPQTATSSMWEKSGKVKGAMEFDGTDDYVETPSIAMSNVEEFSFGFWIYSAIDNEPSGHFPITWGSNKFCRFSGYFLYCTVDGGLTNAAIIDKNVSDSSWHHILFISNSNSQKIYLDGELNNASGKTLNTESGVVIVGAASGYNFEFTGKIDEVKIWNYALTEDEIKIEYNQGASAVMGEDTSRTSVSTTITGASKEYCIPGDTSQCDSPVLELKFDELSGTTAYDTSGDGNDGTIEGASWGRGKYGGGLSFDEDNNNYVNIGTGVMDFSGDSGSFTTSVWIRIDKDIASNRAILGSSVTPLWGIYVRSTNDDLAILMNDGVDQIADHAGPILDDSKWHFVVMTSNSATNEVLGYVDGNEVINLDSTDINDLGDSFRVGGANGFSYFDDFIDDVKIYNYARTPAQIAWDYNRGKPIAHWKFDECSGSTIHDESGNGNHGTLNLGTGGVTATGTCASSSDSFWYNGKDGKRNSGGSFDGGDDWAYSPLEAIDYDEVTVSVWFKADMQDDNGEILVWGDTLGSGNNFLSIFQYNAGNGCFRFYSDNSSRVSVVADNTKWHHGIIVLNSLNLWTFYFDGSALGTFQDDITHTHQIDGHNIFIGADYWGTFDGQIDEVKIWNYALTAEQVKTEYSGGAVRFE